MKIGITIDFAVSFWANGMQQNIVFLYNLLSRIPGNECYYLFNETRPHSLGYNHKGMKATEASRVGSKPLDVLIIAGFDLEQESYDGLIKNNPDLKIILIHYGNKLLDDMSYCLGPETTVNPVKQPKYISQVWTSPQYSFSHSYLSGYYKTEEVYECSYIWEPLFIQEKLKSFNIEKKPGAQESKKTSVCIFEPNKNLSKNCIVPLSIINYFETHFPGELHSCGVFCTEHLRKKTFFKKYINRLEISNKKDFLYFNDRWSMTEACSKFGEIIVSHQILNDLNYLYFESLYLGLPLVHNSKTLSSYGYYYPEFDVKMGANQIKNVLLNHSSVLSEYKSDNQKLFAKYSPYSNDNIASYDALIKKCKPAKSEL
tara:strand:- start:1706 stop:2818 length:1113 start_codon:yes stop_codon:yes gene_type:complete